MINDISLMDVGCKLGILRIDILTYADDIVISLNFSENIDKVYTKFEASIVDLKLKINIKVVSSIRQQAVCRIQYYAPLFEQRKDTAVIDY